EPRVAAGRPCRAGGPLWAARPADRHPGADGPAAPARRRRRHAGPDTTCPGAADARRGPRLVARCAAAVAELLPEAGDRLLHWDLHYANVLAGEREPWLAIDPKPLAGDPGSHRGRDLRGEHVQVVQVGHVQDLHVDPGRADLAVRGELLDHLARGADHRATLPQ